MSERYWAVAWGHTVRGPYGKSSIVQSCKDAYGIIAANMLCVDLGTRIGPIRSSKFTKICQAAVALCQKGHDGIYRADWDKLTVEPVARWAEEPYRSMLPKMEHLYADKKPQLREFEARMERVEKLTDEAAEEIWKELFGTSAKKDKRYKEYLKDAGYENVEEVTKEI